MNSGWQPGGSYRPSYALDAQGVVHLEGALLQPNPATSAQYAFTLPAGIAPGATSGGFPRYFAIIGDGGSCIEETPAVLILDNTQFGPGNAFINNPTDCGTYYLNGVSYVP